MRAVALLSFWKLRNSLRTLFTDPRKLIPAVFIVIALGCSMVPVLMVSIMPRAQPVTPTVDPNLLHAGISMAMILIGMMVLNTGLGDNLLAFAMPDVDYLFPSPISRRLVLAYRLPSLTGLAILSVGLFVVMLTVFTGALGLTVPQMGQAISPKWLPLAAVSLCVGIYLNLALFLSVQFRNRSLSHRILNGCILALLALLGAVVWRAGLGEAIKVIESPWLGWGLLPSRLATDALFAVVSHHSASTPMRLLALGYGLSLVPLFSTNANFYEASIVSTERASAIRQAAKGGYASLAAARAANTKRKPTRPYTVAPFGEGAMALFWAHLCAAAKKPFSTFVSPALGGVIVGVAGALSNGYQLGVGYGVIGFVAFYASIIFMTGGKTASEAAIRRRELISPLPIPAWKAVAANLGVPGVVVVLFAVAAAAAYTVAGGANWAIVDFALVLLFPTRLMGRMILQYGLVIGYADLADKVQQMMGGLVYYAFAAPLAVVELLACIPAIIIQSPWLAVITLSVVNIPILAGLLVIVGRASERAVASGEPVSLFTALRK